MWHSLTRARPLKCFKMINKVKNASILISFFIYRYLKLQLMSCTSTTSVGQYRLLLPICSCRLAHPLPTNEWQQGCLWCHKKKFITQNNIEVIQLHNQKVYLSGPLVNLKIHTISNPKNKFCLWVHCFDYTRALANF